MTTASTIISQLKPFSEHRFDACMNYLMHTYGQNPTQYEITKLHVMIDFFHVLETGKQSIGGPLKPWTWGPVIDNGFNRVKRLAHRFDEEGRPVNQGKIRVIGKNKKNFIYAPYDVIDESTFSPAEMQAMKMAWECIMFKTMKERTHFFHNPSEYMGKVWSKARKDKAEDIDWSDLIDAYDAQNNEDHSYAKMLINCWR